MTNEVENGSNGRSELWNEIFETLAKLDLNQAVGDSVDRPSACTEIEEKILKFFSKNEKDTERLDFLQTLTQGYGGGWLLRESVHKRGMRLHETRQEGATPNIRHAIDNYAAAASIDKVTMESSEFYEYEVLIKDSTIFEHGSWVPITTDRIKRPENIEKYIQHGILRKINR